MLALPHCFAAQQNPRKNSAVSWHWYLIRVSFSRFASRFELSVRVILSIVLLLIVVATTHGKHSVDKLENEKKNDADESKTVTASEKTSASKTQPTNLCRTKC